MKIISGKLLSLVMTIALLTGISVPFTVMGTDPPADPFYFFDKNGNPNYIVNGDDVSLPIGEKGSIGTNKKLNFTKNGAIPADAEALVFFFDLTGEGMDKTANGEFNNMLSTGVCVMGTDNTPLYGRPGASSSTRVTTSGYLQRQMLYHWHGDYKNESFTGTPRMSYGGDNPTSQASFPANGSGYVIIRAEDIINDGGVATSIADAGYIRLTNGGISTKMDYLAGHTLELSNPGYLMDADAFIEGYEFSQADYKNGLLPEWGDIKLDLGVQAGAAAQLSWNAFSGAAQYQVNLYTAGGIYTFDSETQTGDLTAALASLAPATTYAVQVVALDAGGTAIAASNKVEFTTEYPDYFYNTDGSLNYIVNGDNLSLPITGNGQIGSNKRMYFNKNNPVPAGAEALVFFFDLTGDDIEKTSNGEFKNKLPVSMCIMNDQNALLYGRQNSTSTTAPNTSYIKRQLLYNWHGNYYNQTVFGSGNGVAYGGDHPSNQSSFPTNGYGYVIIRPEDIISGGVATSIAEAACLNLTSISNTTSLAHLAGYTLKLMNPGYLMDVDAFIGRYELSQRSYKDGPLPELSDINLELNSHTSDAAQLSWNAFSGAAQYQVNLYTAGSIYTFVSEKLTGGLTAALTSLEPASGYAVQVLALDANGTALTTSNTVEFTTNNPDYFYDNDGKLNYIVNGDSLSLPIGANGTIGSNKKLYFNQYGAVPANAEALVFFFDLTGDDIEKTSNGEFLNKLPVSMSILDDQDSLLYGRNNSASSAAPNTNYITRHMLYHWHGDFYNDYPVGGRGVAAYGGDHPNNQSSFPSNAYGYFIVKAEDIKSAGLAESIAEAAYLKLTTITTRELLNVLAGHTLELKNPGYLLDTDLFIEKYELSTMEEYEKGPLAEGTDIQVQVTNVDGNEISLSWNAFEGAGRYMVNAYAKEGRLVSTRYTRQTAATIDGLALSTDYRIQVLALDANDQIISASNILECKTTDKVLEEYMKGLLEFMSGMTIDRLTVDGNDITVTWDWITGVKTYKAHLYKMVGDQYVFAGEVTVNGDEGHCTFQNLDGGTTYCVQLVSYDLSNSIVFAYEPYEFTLEGGGGGGGGSGGGEGEGEGGEGGPDTGIPAPFLVPLLLMAVSGTGVLTVRKKKSR